MTSSSVLIIDDDQDFAEVMAQFLTLCGHRVEVACTGQAGIAAARGCSHGVILLDIGLPDLNGVEILRRIRRIDPDAVCYLMTGYSVDELSRQGIAEGAADVLGKPIDPEALARRLCAPGAV